MNESSGVGTVELQLGDIIKLIHPSNDLLNDQIFIIDYIDVYRITLINVESMEKRTIQIKDGIFGDGGITEISILSRADSPSYAEQHDLLPGTWVDIHFGGDLPVIITGEITNKEEDMIEITSVDKDVLYLNFDYKGLPENVPIDLIEIRNKPERTTVSAANAEKMAHIEEKSELETEPEPEPETYMNVGDLVTASKIQSQLREFIIKADEITFGNEELGPLTQYVDVSTKKQRYSIDVQVADLLDELLSTVPNAQRTPRVLNNIHQTIERFKQLREQFSTFNEHGIVTGVIKTSATHKPLATWLQEFSTHLYWILPVVKNIKKLYFTDKEPAGDDSAAAEGVADSDNTMINMNTEISQLNDIFATYKSNSAPTSGNKYGAFFAGICDNLTPFETCRANTPGVISQRDVHVNLNVIVDNLEDMYSTVFANDAMTTRRFIINRYNLGESKLDLVETSTASKTVVVQVPVFPNDKMSLSSVMMLPEPAIRFSKINLPGTNILDRANLDGCFMNYWQLLTQRTGVQNVFVDSLDTQLNFQGTKFATTIRNFALRLPDDIIGEMSEKTAERVAIYNKFTEMIVPKIRTLFKLMKKYVHGKISIVDIVSYLEPFLVYTDDLTFKQYQEIVRFIDEQISEKNKKLVEYSRVFRQLTNIKSPEMVKSKAYALVETLKQQMHHDVFKVGYGMDMQRIIAERKANVELLKRLLVKDASRLYTSALAMQNIQLSMSQVARLLEVEKDKVSDKIKKDAASGEKNGCNTIIIAKMYTSEDQLQADNGGTIYFDKKYDKTNYGVMEDTGSGYAKNVLNMSPEELKKHITQDQMKKNGLSKTEAEYTAETLIQGFKTVKDGQYAILYKGYAEQAADEVDYYIRDRNQWKLDGDMSKRQVNTDETSVLCNLQAKCASVPTKTGDSCETIAGETLAIKHMLLRNILNEFDSSYKVSKEELFEKCKTTYNYNLHISPILARLAMQHFLKYNNTKYKIGVTSEEERDMKAVHIVSPYAKLLDMILGQKEFTKKQQDIIRFVNKYTKVADIVQTAVLPGDAPGSHWLYCIQTGVPLIPTFKMELATAFLSDNYVAVLEQIKAKIGQLSDDGDWWTDKYSGWPICPGEFDVEEGYEEGFKVITRAVVEGDAGNKIAEAMSATATIIPVKYQTKNAKMISGVVNALSAAMGINIETQKEFIINVVVSLIDATVESEDDYAERIKIAAQKGKKMPSYVEFYNTSLLYYTLGSYLIATQTIVPSIKTRKTHPGCVRSFEGYPFQGTGDISSLQYLACIVYDIRDSGEPWNVLKRANSEKIAANIRAAIDGYLLAMPEVIRKMEEKTEYLLVNPAVDIPTEHDITNWTNYLPPLLPFTVSSGETADVSQNFRDNLKRDLRTGAETQTVKLGVLQAKVLACSLAVQETIQGVIGKQDLLLHTANHEPYLENACCNTGSSDGSAAGTVMGYFESSAAGASADLKDLIAKTQRMANILYDIRAVMSCPIFYSIVNTKNLYPPTSAEYSEKTIYMGFIENCKFKTLQPIPANLVSLCGKKPEGLSVGQTEPLDKIILKMKESGQKYTQEQYIRLMQLVGREHMSVIRRETAVTPAMILQQLLAKNAIGRAEGLGGAAAAETLMNNETEFCAVFMKSLESGGPEGMRDLNNYLQEEIDQMRADIVTFVQQNGSTKMTKRQITAAIVAINDMQAWSILPVDAVDGVGSGLAGGVGPGVEIVSNFFKTYVDNFANIFPEIIMKNVNYAAVDVPKHYEFSESHERKLRQGITKYFEILVQLYSVAQLRGILGVISGVCKRMYYLSRAIRIGGLISVRTGMMLYAFCLLKVLMYYVELTNNPEMLVMSLGGAGAGAGGEIDEDMVVGNRGRVMGASMQFSGAVGVGGSAGDARIAMGNKKELKQKVNDLIIVFMRMFAEEKDTVDINYETLKDKLFKLKEREKDMVTDRLKSMTDDDRNTDTVMKINKLGMYNKSMQKGFTKYDKGFYEEEQDLRDEMTKTANAIRRKRATGMGAAGRGVGGDDVDMDDILDGFAEERQEVEDIDDEENDMSGMNDDYYNGYDATGYGEDGDEYGDYN